MAWSPSGNELATGSGEGGVTVSSDRGCCIRCLDGPVNAIAWSPDGALVAFAAGWTVSVLDDDGLVVAEVGPLEGAVHDLAWVDGPGTLAAATMDAVAWITPGQTAQPLDRWEVAGAARSLATDPARTRLASGDLAGVLRVTDLATRHELAVTGFEDRIEQLRWDPTGTRIAVTDHDKVTVWSLDGIDLVDDDPVVLSGHLGRITDTAFAPDLPARLATVGADGLLGRRTSAGRRARHRPSNLVMRYRLMRAHHAQPRRRRAPGRQGSSPP